MWNSLRCKNTFQLPFVSLFLLLLYFCVSISTLAEHKQNARHRETKFDTRLGAQMDCTMNCRCSSPTTCALSTVWKELLMFYAELQQNWHCVPKKIYLYLSATCKKEKQRPKSVRGRQLGELSALLRLVCVINYGKASCSARMQLVIAKGILLLQLTRDRDKESTLAIFNLCISLHLLSNCQCESRKQFSLQLTWQLHRTG